MSTVLPQRRFRMARHIVGGPVGLRLRLERLGPTYIKLGQYLALRPDLIPQAYCDELMVLFDRVAPFPWSEARAILTTELGADPAEVFASIDPVPFAAGSLAQTHLARLADGAVVAVKVQRPNLRRIIERDLSRARLLARFMEISGVSFLLTPRQLADELSEWLVQEINFRHELANITLLHRLAANSSIEVIPQAYPDLSTERVLTMEYLAGVPISDLLGRGASRPVEGERAIERHDGAHGLTADDVDRNRVATNLITATLRQIFRYQFFHADLHPGNLFAMPDGAIGFVDFGLCDSWDGTMRWRLLRYLAAVYSGEVEKMYGALSEILIPGERTDMAAFRADFYAESRRWTSRMRTSLEARGAPQERGERSPIAQWMIAVMRIARVHGLRVPPMIVSIYRALFVAETVANQLDAEADLRSVGRSFFDRLQSDEAVKAIEPRNLQPTVLNYVSYLRDAPGQVNQILAELAEGTFALTVHTVEPPRVARTRNRRARAVVLSVLSVGVTVLLTRPDLPELQGISLAWPLAALLLVLYVSVFFELRRLR